MFNRFLGGFRRSIDPNTVLEVDADEYIYYKVIERGEGLVLYETEEAGMKKLEAILLTSNKAYSIYRRNDEVEGQLLFGQFCEKLPLLIEYVPTIASSKFVLQNVCQLLQDNPNWTAAHIAAHYGYSDCFKNKVIQSQINISCEDNLMTPLHVAVKAQQIKSVLQLVELDARFDITDINGDTVFHYAATTTKDIIQVLCRKPVPSIINMYNNKGCTPFHLACMADKTDCVLEFIKAGVDVNLNYDAKYIDENEITFTDSPSRSMKDVLDIYSNKFYNSDIKYGGTPLHWSRTPEFTEVLIEHGCSVNARNFQGDTALHVMVKRNRLSCAVSLLSHNADADLQNADGNTPLHLAVKSGDLSFVQLFISFGGDMDMLNNKGETPRHLAANEKKAGSGEILYSLHMVGAKRCKVPMNSCNDGCSINGQFNGIPPENCAFCKKTETLFEEVLASVKGHNEYLRCTGSPQKGCRVLTLDGGGIKGMVLIQMLDELEKIMGKPISTCFDVVAGTSTGGVLALVLASGKSMKDCRCLYFRLKDKVFVGSRPYDAELLETFLKNELGETTVMGDIEKPRIMITATRGDRKPADLHIFRNYESPLEILNKVERDVLTDEVLPNSKDQLLWKVGRATGAAPTYFRASGPFIDGGLISNNPTLDALTEIHQCNEALIASGQREKACKIKVVVSMGTGRPPVVPVNNIDVFRPDSFWGVCKMALGVTNLGQLLVNQATQTDGRVTERALAICNMLNIPYIRLNPQLTEDIGLDETNTKILVKMLWETTVYMRVMGEELAQLKALLTA